MKLLENAVFESISRQLNGQGTDGSVETGVLNYRMEMYSCKMTSNERKEYKAIANKLGKNPVEVLEALSPPQLSSSPFASDAAPPLIPTDDVHLVTLQQNDSNLSLNDLSVSSGTSDYLTHEGKEQYTYTANQKTLFHLKACMTSSFEPDYDFSDTNPDEFSREPNLAWITNHINQTLMTALRDNCSDELLHQLWRSLDKAITLKDTIVYSYNPSVAGEEDPFSNCLWGFAFLFFNHKLNRVVLVACSSDKHDEEHDRFLMSSDDEGDFIDLECEYYKDADPSITASRIAENMFKRGFSRQRSESYSRSYQKQVEREHELQHIEQQKQDEEASRHRRRTDSSNSKLFAPHSSSTAFSSSFFKSSLPSSSENLRRNSNGEIQFSMKM